MTIAYWFPVVTLLIGWFLNELHHWFWSNREERKPFGKALTDLLELWHDLKGLRIALFEIKKRFPISEDDERVIIKLLEDILPKLEDLQRRFNDAVTSIASIDPMLAFRLRGKDQYRLLLEWVRALAKVDGLGKQLSIWLEDKLTDAFLSNLEELIIDVAKAHGLRTWWKVHKRISKPVELPKEIDEILAQTLKEGDRVRQNG